MSRKQIAVLVAVLADGIAGCGSTTPPTTVDRPIVGTNADPTPTPKASPDRADSQHVLPR